MVRETNKEPILGLEEYSPLLRTLLTNRGIKSDEDAKRFLAPSYERDSYDPLLMLDMKKSVDRILQAIRNKEKIVIFGDYDCDGIPGSVILHDFLKKVGHANFSNYIPHRHNEGYGLNTGALEKFANDGASLVITVDCGIVDFKPADRARELSLDLIITDHHLPQEKLPDAYAVINPKRDKDPYPDKMLCGAGVAFKLVQALIKQGDFENIHDGWEKWLLDMAGLSTIADMVPLQNENRMIAYYGLKVLRKSRRPGIRKLLEKARVQQKSIVEDDVGFMIAPRLNAAGRMDDPLRAFELLASQTEDEAETLANFLNSLNNKRKGAVASMVKEARQHLSAREMNEVIVTGDPRWSPGLLGLAANTLMDEFCRPAFVWGRAEDGTIKGSCRSNGSVSVVELMAKTKDMFIQFGGHDFSGGFSVLDQNIHELESELTKSYNNMEKTDVSSEKYTIDAELSLDDITWETYDIIQKLAPYGIENPKPIFLFKDIVVENIREFGKTGTHLELIARNTAGNAIKAIAFFKKNGDFGKILEHGAIADLAGSFEKSTFGIRPELQIRIVNIT